MLQAKAHPQCAGSLGPTDGCPCFLTDVSCWHTLPRCRELQDFSGPVSPWLMPPILPAFPGTWIHVPHHRPCMWQCSTTRRAVVLPCGVLCRVTQSVSGGSQRHDNLFARNCSADCPFSLTAHSGAMLLTPLLLAPAVWLRSEIPAHPAQDLVCCRVLATWRPPSGLTQSPAAQGARSVSCVAF